MNFGFSVARTAALVVTLTGAAAFPAAAQSSGLGDIAKPGDPSGNVMQYMMERRARAISIDGDTASRVYG
ncbi:MAG: hypothetical protein WAU13_11670, partial [Albidovulum sp.]